MKNNMDFKDIEKQCENCEHILIRLEVDGWCYMFKDPIENCTKFKPMNLDWLLKKNED